MSTATLDAAPETPAPLDERTPARKAFMAASGGSMPEKHAHRGNSLYLFRTEVLPAEEDRSFTQLDVALLLGISSGYVSRLESKEEEEVPPAIRLACYYIDRVGWEAAEEVESPDSEEIEGIVSQIFLDKKQLCSLMGLSRQGFLSIRRGHVDQVKMYYKLAILELHERFGFTEDDLRDLSSMLCAGSSYQSEVAARGRGDRAAAAPSRREATPAGATPSGATPCGSGSAARA